MSKLCTKYRNIRSGGYASKREEKRAGDLKILERVGAISGLQYQVKYEIIPACGTNRAAHYIADFTYLEQGAEIVEDCKGFRTAEYILKKKLMRYVHGIEIRET